MLSFLDILKGIVFQGNDNNNPEQCSINQAQSITCPSPTCWQKVYTGLIRNKKMTTEWLEQQINNG